MPVMAVDVPPGAYQVACGAGLTSEEAAHGLFPDDARVVLVKTDWVSSHGVVYTFFVDYPDN